MEPIDEIKKSNVKNLLQNNERIDRRGMFEFRPIEITRGFIETGEGSALVKLGNTTALSVIKFDVVEPFSDKPDEGVISTNSEILSMSSERFEAGPPGERSIELARVVDRGIRESGFIDWKKLCIKEGEKVWSVIIDIYCINDDGNVMDASALGAISALKAARFPIYDEKTERVQFGEFTDTPLPLTEKLPLTLTFHKIGDKLVLDPNRDEEDSSDARVTLAVSSASKKEKMINAMQKGGITPFTMEEMEKVIEESEKAYDKIFSEVEKKIKHISKEK
jgi:exosome complex component RRP42